MENEKLVEVLNDLIRINNDRIEGYTKATEELSQPGYDNARPMFLERTNESGVFVNELSSAVMRLGGEPAETQPLRVSCIGPGSTSRLRSPGAPQNLFSNYVNSVKMPPLRRTTRRSTKMLPGQMSCTTC